MVCEMIELSGRKITGVARMSERNATEFKALVAAVDACEGQPVRLDLTDLNVTTLWRRDAFFELALRSNLTLILDPETASVLNSYLTVTGGKAKYEVKELEVVPEKEDPELQERGMVYAAAAFVQTKTAKIPLDKCEALDVEQGDFICFDIRDTGLDMVSSIGLSGQCIRRAIEIITEKAAKLSLKLLVDFTDIYFEGGCDIVLADALVECRKLYKIPMKVVGDEGIAEYVKVAGNVRLPAEAKVRYFKRILPNTVLRLNTYRVSFRSDIAGRKGSGVLAGASIVLFRGVEGTDALYDEIPTQRLYLPEDLEILGETQNIGDIRIPRRRSLLELGMQNICTGSHGHFGTVAKDEVYQISDGKGGIREVSESFFVARGLEALGLSFNKELLMDGRILPPKEKR